MHATAASALGLGEIVEQSAIGQSLRVRIALVGTGDELDPACVRLAPATGNELPWVRDARLAIERRLTGTFLIVSNNQPAYHPILKLGIAAGCDGGLRREYTLLLPANPALAAGRGAARPVTGPTADDRASTAARVPAGPSLNDLALRAFPSDRGARRRFIAAARKRAPELFPDGPSLGAPLPADAGVDADELARIARSAPKRRSSPAAPAPREPIAKAPTVAAAEPPPNPRKAPAAAQPGAATTPVADRLVLFGGDPATHLKLSFSLSDPARASTTSEAERQRLREEQRLVMALDEKIMTQMEIVARIRELEALQAQLAAESSRLDRLATDTGITAAPGIEPRGATRQASDGDGAAADAAPAASAQPIAPSGATERRWPDWLLPVAGSLAAAVLALLLMLRRRRDTAPEPAFEPRDGASREHSLHGGKAAKAGSADGIGGMKVDFPLDDDGAQIPVQRHDLDLDEVGGEAPTVDFAPLDWTPPADDLSAGAAAAVVDEEELGEEHESAVELADIMMSFGRIQGAAHTLADFIRHNPKQGVSPWIKLLDVYKAGDMRGEFDTLTRQLNATFNVKVVSWDEFDVVRLSQDTVESLPHIVKNLTKIWATRDAQVYLHALLRDNRDGTRQGFPIAVVDEILFLLSVLNELVGHFKQMPGDFDKDEAPATESCEPGPLAEELVMDPLEIDPK
ncbi:MAG: hypothetical protein KDH15_15060 [Rhodocyclaceae bacterium]|nr:hypothetical protein [Rhodocyclaceae bacterium]